MIRITFDKDYAVKQSIEFTEQAKKNKIPFKTYVYMKSPYSWFIEIDEKFKPLYLKYYEASVSDKKYMLQTVIPITPSEEAKLIRRQSDAHLNSEKFISPEIFIALKDKEYGCIFKYSNLTKIKTISKYVEGKIYILGKQREWYLAFTYNKSIREYVEPSDILLEKTSSGDYNQPGSFELALNTKILNTTSLNNKYIHYPYVEKEIYYPLKPIG